MKEELVEWILYVCMSTTVDQCPSEDLAFMRHLDKEECEYYETDAKEDVPTIDTACVYYDRRGI